MTIPVDVFRIQCLEFVKRCRELGDDWSLKENKENGDLRDVSAHDELDTSTLMLTKNELRKTPKGDKICSYEYTVIYSESYQVPVMYFCASDQNGCPADIDELIISEAPDLSRVINQVEHPILFRPFYMIHPCRTENFMQFNHKSDKDGYLISWLSVVGTLLNLKINPDFGKSQVQA